MLIVLPDFDRRIDLPGAGPCPRPVEIDRSGTGFSDLVSLRVYAFAQGVTIDGEAEDDEVFIVAMRGHARIAIAVAGEEAGAFLLANDGGLRAVYMPPHAAYRLTADSDCDIAYARAQPTGPELPQVRGFPATGTRLDISGHAQAMDLVLVAARAGEHIDLAAKGRLPERFVHVRGHDFVSAALDGASLGDWSTVALAVGDASALTIEAGSGDILVITAATDPVDAQALSIETLADGLIANPDRLEPVNYAEMGVPMFLIGEDAAAPLDDGAATDCLGQHFAALAGELATRKPELETRDVAKLLELLARRDFLPRNQSAPVCAQLSLPAAAPPVLGELAAGLARSRAIRLVNFHATPRYREAEYRRQIETLARDFEPITPANFAAAVDGRWDHDRPGLMPALFEGYRDNLDVLLPILEEFGFTAWFFVPSGFLSVPPHEQRSYAASHTLHLPEIDEYPDERIALTWDEARNIVRRGHAFACHTRTHHEVTPDTPRAVLEEEIAVAKAEMETELGTAIEIFCWLGGVALGTNPEADALLRQAGFRYLLSNFKIQKL